MPWIRSITWLEFKSRIHSSGQNHLIHCRTPISKPKSFFTYSWILWCYFLWFYMFICAFLIKIEHKSLVVINHFLKDYPQIHLYVNSLKTIICFKIQYFFLSLKDSDKSLYIMVSGGMALVARQKIRAASAWQFFRFSFALIGSLESPPSI